MEEEEDERTARVLVGIANSIVMEYDMPSRNIDCKMAILYMKVWIDYETGIIMFQHYEKPTALHNIMHA